MSPGVLETALVTQRVVRSRSCGGPISILTTSHGSDLEKYLAVLIDADLLPNFATTLRGNPSGMCLVVARAFVFDVLAIMRRADPLLLKFGWAVADSERHQGVHSWIELDQDCFDAAVDRTATPVLYVRSVKQLHREYTVSRITVRSFEDVQRWRDGRVAALFPKQGHQCGTRQTTATAVGQGVQ